MKVAFLSESPADEAAVCILAAAILGEKIIPEPAGRLRTRGWPSILNLLPSVMKHLHYKTDVTGLVLVVDSDDSPVHSPEHEQPRHAESKCRLCQLRRLRDETVKQLRPVPNRSMLKTAIGIAIPAIEAWLLVGHKLHPSEAGWRAALGSGNFAYQVRDLKKTLYGTDRPSLARETECMTKAAQEIADNLGALTNAFPCGFGALVKELQSWKSDSPQ